MLQRLYFEVEAVSKTCSEENGLGHHKRFGFKSPTNLGNHTVVTAIHHFFKVHLRYGHWVFPNATMSRIMMCMFSFWVKASSSCGATALQVGKIIIIRNI